MRRLALSQLLAALCATLFIASFVGNAGAQGYGMGPGWGMQQGMGSPGRGRFAIIDLNDDGKVSAEEAASAADEVFTAMDADDDGMLTLEEYMSVRMGPQQGWNSERQEAMQAQKEARFGEFDADGDGSVTKAEFMDGAKAHHQAADTDGDGVVTPWEQRRRNWN